MSRLDRVDIGLEFRWWVVRGSESGDGAEDLQIDEDENEHSQIKRVGV